MTAHAAFERLAVGAIDFRLAPDEREELERHIAGCDACRSMAGLYQADAAALREIALVPSPARVRRAVLAESARRAPVRPVWQWLAVAALLAAMLAGVLAAAGAFLRLVAEEAGPLSWSAAPEQAAFVDPAGSMRLAAVAARGARLVAVGSSSAQPVVLTSDDGLSWTRVHDDAAFRGATLVDVAFLEDGNRPNTFVVVGSRDGRPTAWWSPDGRSWVGETIDDKIGSAIAVTAWSDATVALGWQLSASESEGAESTVLAAWQLSARAWEPATIAVEAPAALGSFSSVVRTEARLFALGGPRTFVSMDGRLWEPLPGEPLALEPAAVTRGQGWLVAVGNSEDAARFRISRDGATWRDVTPPVAGAARVLGVTFAEGLFVAFGGAGRGAVTWTSHDGETWRQHDVVDGGAGAQIADAAWASGRLAAVGGRGAEAAVWLGGVERP